MKIKQILALILTMVLGISIVSLDARAEDPESYAPNGYQEIEDDINRSLLDDSDTIYSITKETVHGVKQGQRVSFTLEQDSYVEFNSCKNGDHYDFYDGSGRDSWLLDNMVQEIYISNFSQKFFLKKGYHYMKLVHAQGYSGKDGCWIAGLTYTIHPTCGIYYPLGDGYEKVTSYTLQSHSQTMDIPERSFSGYTFEGWYEDEGLTIPFTSVDMSIGKDWYVYPKLTPIVYTITYEMNGGVNNLENPNGYTIEDKKITLQPPTKEGYKFSRWYILSGGKKVTVTEINAPDLKNIKVFAEWSEQEYSITYENVDKHGNPSIYKASNGTIALDPPSKRKGYEFAGWYLDAACTRSVTAIDCSMKKNITIYAKWKPISYTVIYELNGGRQNTDNPNGYTIEDEKIALQPPTKDKAEFEGWFTDPTFKKKITEIDPTNCTDIKLYAKWKIGSSGTNASPTPKPSITPTPKPSPTVTIDPSDEEYKILRDSKVLKREEGKRRFDLGYFPTDGKIIFTKGLEDGDPLFYLDSEENHLTEGEEKNVSELSGHISQGIHYIYLSYTHPTSCGRITTVSYVFYPKCRVYCVYNNQTTEIASYYLKDSHSTLTLKAPDIKGCRVLGLYADRQLTVPVDSVSMGIGKDWYVYPKVEPHTYSITYDLNGGVNHIENKTTYTIEDEDLILKAPTKEGYTFEGWFTDPTFKKKITKINPADCKNIKIYAKWKKDLVKPTPNTTPIPTNGPIATPSVTSEPDKNPEITKKPEKNPTVYRKPVKVKNVRCTPKRSKRTVKVYWSKTSPASGYIVRYSYKKNMAGSRSIKIPGPWTHTKTLRKLRPKKYLYVQVRSYIKNGDRLVKGPWSNVTRSKGKIR